MQRLTPSACALRFPRPHLAVFPTVARTSWDVRGLATGATLALASTAKGLDGQQLQKQAPWQLRWGFSNKCQRWKFVDYDFVFGNQWVQILVEGLSPMNLTFRNLYFRNSTSSCYTCRNITFFHRSMPPTPWEARKLCSHLLGLGPSVQLLSPKECQPRWD